MYPRFHLLSKKERVPVNILSLQTENDGTARAEHHLSILNTRWKKTKYGWGIRLRQTPKWNKTMRGKKTQWLLVYMLGNMYKQPEDGTGLTASILAHKPKVCMQTCNSTIVNFSIIFPCSNKASPSPWGLEELDQLCYAIENLKLWSTVLQTYVLS